MGKSYGHVTIEERCEIARLQASGYSIRQIAASLDRSASTVARELKRNGSRTLGYQARYAEQAHARRWQGSRLERDRGRGKGALSAQAGLVSGAGARSQARGSLSRGRATKRGWRGRKGGSPGMRRPIAERPQSAADRHSRGRRTWLFRGHAGIPASS